ncbi:MAG: hypothetical protein CMC84_07960 [Flavobacteriaceae bacterium]|nr:hypothetical protein [Flavobacteriaceae bacterium]
MYLSIYLSFYILIIISVIGYGLLLQNILKNITYIEFEYNLLGSLLFLILLSFLTHFFFNHGYVHNMIILILGIILFVFNFFKEKKFFKKYLNYICLIFGILLVAFLTAKTHDDFPYYHFPYTYYLTQENLIIGVGNLVHAFRTPSSIFYLNSLFYLPVIEYFLFNMGAILIFGFSNLILLFKLKNDFKNKRYDFIFFLTLLSILFINIFFYRLAEHGTDRSAQILIFILFIEVFSLYRKSTVIKQNFTKIFILLGLIISLKSFYMLYLLILIPILLHFKMSKFFLNSFKDFYFYTFCFVGFFLILINIFNSGCVVYPVSVSCFSNFEWSTFNEAKASNDWFEQWAKAGAGPNYRVDNPENYIKGFNWVPNWIELYFFNKVSDFILGLLLLLTIVFFSFYSKNRINVKIKKQNFYIYLVIIILFFEWFYNHPSLRYGGYILVALIMFVPFSIYISKFISLRLFQKKVVLLIVLSMVIFVGRNINRINNEVKKYDYNLFSYPYYYLDDVHFRVDKFIDNILLSHQSCIDKNKINCEGFNGISVTKKFYYILKK